MVYNVFIATDDEESGGGSGGREEMAVRETSGKFTWYCQVVIFVKRSLNCLKLK